MGGEGSGHGSGGKRPGAGRPTGSHGPKLYSWCMRLTLHEKETLKARAAAAGVSQTEYVKMQTIGGK